MNERFICLMEKYFDGNITQNEKQEFDQLILNNPDLKNEFEDQKRIKEVLNKMIMKNPSAEVWDSYWLGIYRKIERGFAWIAISVGLIIVSGFAIVTAIDAFLKDTTTPLIVKWGTGILLVGVLILLISLIREKIFTYKKDKYKEIQR